MRVFLNILLGAVASLGAICVAAPDIALAQQGGCTVQRIAGPPRQIIRCPDGVVVTAELGARFNLVDRDRDGRVDALSLRSKAVLVDVDRQKRPNGFEVMTPQAIAAVRGTRWAVDVKNGTTSVLVVRGRVAVARPASRASVSLSVGEGVDVSSGSGPLTVRRWPPARSAALLARLGQ